MTSLCSRTFWCVLPRVPASHCEDMKQVYILELCFSKNMDVCEWIGQRLTELPVWKEEPKNTAELQTCMPAQPAYTRVGFATFWGSHEKPAIPRFSLYALRSPEHSTVPLAKEGIFIVLVCDCVCLFLSNQFCWGLLCVGHK